MVQSWSGHRIFRILKFTTDMYLTCLVFIQDILCHLRKHLTFAKPLQIVSIKEVMKVLGGPLPGRWPFGPIFITVSMHIK
ncbi:Os10g0339600 [Oryza sativa Japonica Group]|uniref:Os10g0339600 protein n=1 Tax=Oryza sativa subsp. japonica TaxID=39947 RepID=C7J806_ORYSJ|nr:Os10g0339600 [Oryza sativa Japonica Group]|eukprot:NP_001176091.1 Os10g0339600 [Oryza sativa Japonica Group]